MPDFKLLPCPFCGGEGKIFGSYQHYYASCIRPGCLCALGEIYDVDGMDEHLFIDMETAAYNWNKRVENNHKRKAANRKYNR